MRDVKLFVTNDVDVSDRTVRRTMNSMQELGWLEKDKEGGHYWYPGPRAREFLQVPGSEPRPAPEHTRESQTVRETSRSPQAQTEPEFDEIDEAVEEIDVKASGAEMVRRRRNVMRAILEHLREVEEASPAEIRGKFYPDADVEDVQESDEADAVGYGSEHSWWKNFVYPSLSETELVETGGEGSHTWFYVGSG